MAYRVIPVFVPHLGCPHDCVFCNQRHIAAPEPATAADVTAAIDRAAPLRGGCAQELAFYGGSFTAIPAQQQEELLAAVQGRVARIRVSTRPDCIDEQTLARLARFGVTTIELGAQSMDDTVLRLSGRGHTAQDTVCAAEMIRQAGFQLILQVMAGLPGDTPQLCRETARCIAALKPDGVRIYPVVVIRDTQLYRQYLAGTYIPLTPQQGAQWAADMLEIFDAANIPVIRIGLNPTEELSGGSAVAGAYHPALGEMTWSVRYRRALEAVNGLHSGMCIYVAKGCVSMMTGVRRENMRWLESQGYLHVRVREDETLRRGQVRVE